MATSSRQSSIFGTNDWKTIYKTFRQADFQSYDYETLRKSFIDYLRLYYPETFNDFTESSEYIALLDVIAFMGQSLAFRDDLNTRENFIDTAERRDSVIKLANLVGYNPKRNLAGQGYLKVTSIQTSENIRDINNINLSNLNILWNDPANPAWQEQFNTIVNAALIDSQRVGRPGNSKSILGVKTDEYAVNIPSTSLPVVPFSSTVDGSSMNFELVSMTSVQSDSMYEIQPGPNAIFNMLYRNDSLGYGSVNTGFFVYFKQGTLQSFDFSLAQQISNQIVDVNIQGINNTDTWLYGIDNVSNTYTKWKYVENIYGDGNLQTATSTKKLFSVVSRFNDQVSYTFGDGVFSEIPVGSYRAYVRSGNAMEYAIESAEMQGTTVSFQYVSRVGRIETLTLSLELTLPVTNAQTRESLTSIKERAPTRYYSQNRMVNGEDYNNFPYTLYSSIVKSKALNRSSVGVSRGFDLLDPTGKYSSTNSFAEDGALYQSTNEGSSTFSFNSDNDIVQFINQNLAVTLAGHRASQYYAQHYTRYTINADSGDGEVRWKQVSYDNSNATGYFYVNTVSSPIAIGTYSTGNTKYITAGSMIQLTAPSGYYFDENNQLVAGMVTPISTTVIWTNVLNVVEDGYNAGEGILNNGFGPVTVGDGLPTGAIVTLVLPAFENILPLAVLQECVARMNINQSFGLVFDNSLLSNQVRWSVGSAINPANFAKFRSLGNNRYLITNKELSYYFGSVKNTRFTFDRDKIVYDPVTGKILKDTITLLKTNTKPDSGYPIGNSIVLNIVGQSVQSDGYVNDFAVEVASTDIRNNNLINEPDFFKTVTGYITDSTNNSHFTFFKETVDTNLLTRYQIIPSTGVISIYSLLSQIELIKYDYPVGQSFYARLEDKFYVTESDQTVANIVNVVALAGYSVMTGRQGLFFQYKHNSNNSTRIDPATSNIIDLYLVTQSYYTAYKNYVQDSTDVLPEPNVPTINELTDLYSKVNDYKMMSDGVILNSVRFKPLFGNKAEPQLRATIKVIKSSTTTASDSEIRSSVLTSMNSYFSLDNWDFGDTFYFSELSAYLHSKIGDLVNSVVLVPNDLNLQFGDLYEIRSAPYEIFINAAQGSDIVIIAALTPAELQR